MSSFQGLWRCGLSLFSPLRGSLWSVDLWGTWDCRPSMQWWVCCLCGPSPSFGPSLQCWDGTDTLWARLEPPVSLTGEQPSVLFACTKSVRLFKLSLQKQFCNYVYLLGISHDVEFKVLNWLVTFTTGCCTWVRWTSWVENPLIKPITYYAEQRNLLLTPRAGLRVLAACSQYSAEICMDNCKFVADVGKGKRLTFDGWFWRTDGQDSEEVK